jgi:hypothetical protein
VAGFLERRRGGHDGSMATYVVLLVLVLLAGLALLGSLYYVLSNAEDKRRAGR